MKKNITLAIETTVGDGSLSLFENEILIDVRSGREKISRSDRLLPIILEFLAENKIEKKDLSLIAVSRGPGSFTGARIGLATAIGLKNGLNVPCAGISVFQALRLTAYANSMNHSVIIALLANDDKIISALYDDCDDFKDDATIPRNQSLDEFIAELAARQQETEVLLEKKLLEMIKNETKVKESNPFILMNSLLKFREIESDLSTHVGKAILHFHASDNLKAVYLN